MTIIFLCIIKSHLFAIFMWNFTTTSLSIAEILLFIKKVVENWRCQHCQLKHAYCVMLYAQPILTSALNVYAIFA